MISLKALIAPAFYNLHKDIKADKHTHYFIKGGRGSAKSSFASIEIILGIMKDNGANGIAFRKFGTDLKESVFNQLLWAIDILGVAEYWEQRLSPLKLTYKPTGQEILFRGVDDPQKPKSIKLRNGYFKFVWFEEADQFEGMDEVRTINQSLLRAKCNAKVFYTYNPPKSLQSWINKEVLASGENRVVHHSTYLDVPRKWLGEIFFAEAKYLKQNNIRAYNHEYLGEVTGTGGAVFDNVEIRKITTDEIESFGNVRRGLDFGFSVDPCAYVECCLHNRKLYLFNEYVAVGAGYDTLAEKMPPNLLIYADSAEPRSIFELQQRGLKVSPSIKGKGSVNFGIRKLQDLRKIVIDSDKCPNAAREFTEYELERDRNGNFKAEFPDKNNHTIDAVRYALCDWIVKEKQPKKQTDFEFEVLRPKPDAYGRGTSPNPKSFWR
ncbi:MAG: PBSX family phage terminase large subunit [Firmicutes bacterium]|nr:PBSX family phage terminase large subunit [Bacillota bacterium]